MQSLPRPTGFAVFDEKDVMLEANAAMFANGDGGKDLPYGQSRSEVVSLILSDLKSFDGKPVKQTKSFLKSAAARWAKVNADPVEAETMDGRWKLMDQSSAAGRRHGVDQH